MESIETSDNTKSEGDLVTVCITAYRRPSLVLQAVLSSLNQDYRPLEIDVSDDSPNSDVEEAISLLKIPPDITVRYRRNVPALGEPSNVNSLFANARGRRLILLHDDDMLLPGAISTLARVFDADADVIASFGLQEIMSHDGERCPEQTEDFNSFFHRVPAASGIVSDPLLSALRRQFPNDGFLLLSAAARQIRYRTVEDIGRAGDTDFGIRLAEGYPRSYFAFVPQLTARYRLTDGSSRTRTGICWKLHEELASMRQLTPEQAAARDKLMQDIQVHAMIDNANRGNRRKALEIFKSRSYQKQSSLPEASYHLSLIFVPAIQRFRDAIRVLRTRSD